VEKVLNWVNLADITCFDSSTTGLTTIGTAPGQPTTGALFIADSYAKALPLDDPKKPPYLGE
jgi:hypothetical protein